MRRIILMLLLTLLAFPIELRSDENLPQVFQIVADKCSHGPRRYQTGFLAEGFDGLVTALHGVVDCESKIARRAVGELVFEDLEIAEVDIRNDVALLRSPQLSAANLPRLSTGSVPKRSAKLYIVGHPQSLLVQHRMELTLESADKVLADLIPAGEEKQKLKYRASPSVSAPILSLTGDIQPGHSGAPILSDQGRVIGIGNGGLKSGTVGIGWGIPLSQVQLSSKDSRLTLLDDLEKENATLLFDFVTYEEFSFSVRPKKAKPGEEITLRFSKPIRDRYEVFFGTRGPLPKSVLSGGREVVITVPGNTSTGNYHLEIRYGGRQVKSNDTVYIDNRLDRFSFTVSPKNVKTGQDVRLHLSDSFGRHFRIFIYGKYARKRLPVQRKATLSDGRVIVVKVPENLSDGEFFFEMQFGSRRYSAGPIVVDNPRVHRAPPAQ